jgi:hypothetical protein
MNPWKSFHKPMAIIPCIDENHSRHPWKSFHGSMEVMVTNDMESATCIEVIISINA